MSAPGERITSLTKTEVDALHHEIDYLDPHAATAEAWHAAALAGPCFCAGRFTCTRCRFQAEEN